MSATAATQMMKKTEMVTKRSNVEQLLTASILFYRQNRACLLKWGVAKACDVTATVLHNNAQSSGTHSFILNILGFPF